MTETSELRDFLVGVFKDLIFAEAKDYLSKKRAFRRDPTTDEYRSSEELAQIEADVREKAEKIKKAIYDYTIEHISERGENQYFGGMALVDLGERRQGRELMRENRLPEDFLQKVRSVIR